jgi:hypothetical protein
MLVMATRSTFTSDEWTQLRLAPSFVSVGVSAADPSGLFASMRETLAGSHETIERINAHQNLELFAALAADHSVPDLPDIERVLGNGSNEQQMRNFKQAALDHVKNAVAVLAAKGSPTELDAYRQLLVSVARRAASASKEGGFLGFGGVRISAKERKFIDAVAKAAGLDSASLES